MDGGIRSYGVYWQGFMTNFLSMRILFRAFAGLHIRIRFLRAGLNVQAVRRRVAIDQQHKKDQFQVKDSYH